MSDSLLTFTDTYKVRLPSKMRGLSKSERHKVMDWALADSEDGAGPRGLRVQLNFSNGAKQINGRVYAPRAHQGSLADWTEPYKKKMLKWHEIKKGEPIGHVEDVDYVVYTDELKPWIPDSRQRRLFLRDVQSADPVRIQKAMNKYGLFTDRKWPGATELRGWVAVKDKHAIEMFLKELYDTVSSSGTSGYMACGTCGSNWAAGDICSHPVGSMMDEEDGKGFHMLIAMQYNPREISVVNDPANKTSRVLAMQLMDSAGDDIMARIQRDQRRVWAFNDGEDLDTIDFQIEEVPVNISELIKNDPRRLADMVLRSEVTEAELSDALGGSHYEQSKLIALHDAMHYQYDYNLRWQDRAKQYDEDQMDPIPADAYAFHARLHEMSNAGNYRDSMMNGEMDYYDEKGTRDENSPFLSKKAQSHGTMEDDSIEPAPVAKPEDATQGSSHMDSALWSKLDTVLRVKLKAESTEFDDAVCIGANNTFPLVDEAAVEVARELVKSAELSDSDRDKVSKLIDSRLEAIVAARPKTFESLCDEYKAFGCDDVDARRAAILHLVRTTELSDDERQQLFAPAAVETEDSDEIKELKADYAQLVKDHAALKDEIATLKKTEEPLKDEANEGLSTEKIEKIESPAAASDLDDEAKRKARVSELTAFQQRLVDRAVSLRDNNSEEVATKYLQGKINTGMLPRDFDITAYVPSPAAK